MSLGSFSIKPIATDSRVTPATFARPPPLDVEDKFKSFRVLRETKFLIPLESHFGTQKFEIANFDLPLIYFFAPKLKFSSTKIFILY